VGNHDGRSGDELVQRAAFHDFRPEAGLVRTDTGKFVRTAWRVRPASRDWWVVIGNDGVVQTVYDAGAYVGGPI
jgi:hypothetical protein